MHVLLIGRTRNLLPRENFGESFKLFSKEGREEGKEGGGEEYSIRIGRHTL